jgi:hypothetical protein
LIKGDGEYINFLAVPLISKKEKILEFTINTNYLPNDDCLIVCEISDKNGKSIFWNGEEIKNNTRFTHLHMKIPASISNYDLHMKCFIWNIKKQPIVFENLCFKLYEKVK